MRTARLARWSGSVLSPRTRPCLARVQTLQSRRLQSSAVAVQEDQAEQSVKQPVQRVDVNQITKEEYWQRYEILKRLPSPPPTAALTSSKLHALQARLNLQDRLPLETLARCLVHKSADTNALFNNTSLDVLGRDILGYHTSELILCTYPRLPMEIVYAATKAYVGPAACAAIVKEWGVEAAAQPGGEVDPGLLQFLRKIAGNADLASDGQLYKDKNQKKELDAGRLMKPTLTHASIADTYFGPGDLAERPSPQDVAERPELLRELEKRTKEDSRVTLEDASMSFVRALFGALYLHAGRDFTKTFFDRQIRSRQLDVSRMFYFEQPTRDLSKLCAREGFEPPVARIISETGRRSRHPVFVVGVFSGREKLGEGAGGSLDEARIRAAIAALKGWYLYSPLKLNVPSDTEGKPDAPWEPVMVSGGEVVV